MLRILILPIIVVLLAISSLGMMLFAKSAADRQLWRQVFVAVLVVGGSGIAGLIAVVIWAAQAADNR